MDQRLTQTVPPTAEPVTVAELADHLHITDTSGQTDDLTRLLQTARRLGEKITRRSWMPQTWQLTQDAFPQGSLVGGYRSWYPGILPRVPGYDEGHILLPRGPLIAVLSIEYIDTDGNTQTLDPTAYKVSNAGRENRKSRIAPAYGTVWPATRGEMDAVTVTFSAGYVVTGSPETADVPQELIQGLLLTAAELYKQRDESVTMPNQTPAMIRARNLWWPHQLA